MTRPSPGERSPNRSRRLAIVNVAVAICIAMTSGCGADGEEAKPVRVLLIGDSLAKPKPGGYSQITGKTFAEQLAERLGPRVELVNIARAGSTARGWQREFFREYAEPERPVDLVVLMIGSNDASGLGDEPMPARDYEATMRALVDRSLALTTGSVILAPPPKQNRRRRREEIVTRLGRYRDVIQRICKARERVHCGPDFYALLDPLVHLGSDSVHLNQAGHDMMAAQFHGPIVAAAGLRAPSPR